MRHVFSAMGTVVSIESDERVLDESVRRDVEEIFERADLRFRASRHDSEMSRIAAGELALQRASPRFLFAYSAAIGWRDATDGAFDPYSPTGRLDLSGIVKALAIEEAGLVLDRAAGPTWMINAGGDILTGPVESRRIGIADPETTSLLGSIDVGDGRRAVATSGSAERGQHIWGPDAAHFRQVTVVANDIVTADVLATAVAAGGPATRSFVSEHFACDILTVARSGQLEATPGIRRMLHAPSDHLDSYSVRAGAIPVNATTAKPHTHRTTNPAQ